MSRAGKGGEPVAAPEFSDLLQALRISDVELAKLADVPKGALRRWRRGTLKPYPQRVYATLTAIERDLQEKLKDVQRVREKIEGRQASARDRTRRPEVEGEYRSGGDGPEVVVEGKAHDCEVHDRPKAVTYMLFDGGEVVYVGHSTNLFWRLGHHEREKRFDGFAWVEMGTKRRAMELERALRQQLDPEYNVA